MKNLIAALIVLIALVGCSNPFASSSSRIYDFSYNGKGTLRDPLKPGEGIRYKTVEIVLMEDLTWTKDRPPVFHQTFSVTNISEDTTIEFDLEDFKVMKNHQEDSKEVTEVAVPFTSYPSPYRTTAKLAPKETISWSVTYPIPACSSSVPRAAWYELSGGKVYWSVPLCGETLI